MISDLFFRENDEKTDQSGYLNCFNCSQYLVLCKLIRQPL